MWDHYGDGHFAAYDGVTLKMVAPLEMADKTTCVYFKFGSVADDSPPLRKSWRGGTKTQTATRDHSGRQRRVDEHNTCSQDGAK